MKKTISVFLATILAVGLNCILTPPAHAEAVESTRVIRIEGQDFTLVNKTGIEIHSVYVSPHNEDEWGEDVLGRDTLDTGEEVDIEFSRSEKAKIWDLRVEDQKGAFIEWEKFNLLEISKVTLYYKNGKATADVE